MTELEQLLSEAMKLNGAQRAELAQRLLETVTEADLKAIDPAIDEAWRGEVRRRSEQLRSGERSATPWDVARREIFGR